MKFLFDLGGVFFDWDPNHFFKDIFKKMMKGNTFLVKFVMMSGIFSKMQEERLKKLRLY